MLAQKIFIPDLTLYQSVFISFLGVAAILEGSGIYFGRIPAYYLILAAPIALFLVNLKTKKKIIFPKKLGLIYLLFLMALTFSTTFSLNPFISIFHLILFISLGLLFLNIYNNKYEVKKIIIPFLVVLSIILIFYSLFIQFFGRQFFLVPTHGYQLVYSTFRSHNHLGDFLLLAMLPFLLSPQKLKDFKRLSVFILFFFFFLFSYSRSAYLAHFLTVIIFLIFNWNKIKGKSFAFLVTVSAITLFFSFAILKEFKNVPLVSGVNGYLRVNANLQDKFFRAKRTLYWQQALNSSINKPLLGVGPGNFIFVSSALGDFWNVTYSAHNIFLDFLAEGGAVVLVLFLLFLISAFKSSKKDAVFFYLALSLLINFQTDYTYRIYTIIAIFFILLGLNFEDTKRA